LSNAGKRPPAPARLYAAPKTANTGQNDEAQPEKAKGLDFMLCVGYNVAQKEDIT